MTDIEYMATTPNEQQLLREFQALRPYLAKCLRLNHELNNPLAGILGYTELLLMEKDTLSEDQLDNLMRIVECTKIMQSRLMDIANDKEALATQIDFEDLYENLEVDV